MQRKATSAGLVSPSGIVLESVIEAATAAALVCERNQQQRYAEAASATGLLPGVAQHYQLESDVQGPDGRPISIDESSDDDAIMYDEDARGL